MTYNDDTNWVDNEMKTLTKDIISSRKLRRLKWEPKRDMFRFFVLTATLLLSYGRCCADEPQSTETVYQVVECPCCKSILLLNLEEKSWYDKSNTDWVCDNSWCDNRDTLSRDEPCKECDKYKNEKYNRHKSQRHGGKKRDKK